MARRPIGKKRVSGTSGEGVVRRVAVKVRDHVSLLEPPERTTALPIAGWGELSRKVGGVRAVHMFGGLKSGVIDGLMATARENDAGYRPPNFHNYFVVLCPDGERAAAIVEALGRSDEVEWAYVEAGPTPPPQVSQADDPRQANQGYQDPAPNGIDAEFAWTVAGGDGAGVGFVDLEQGWTLNHEDLNAAGIALISGTNQAYFGHGTAVLGEVCGVDNTRGVVGIAPSCVGRVVSQFQPGGYSTPGAILSALALMSFGDVLLLEAQTTVAGSSFLPVEVEQATFDAIRLATAIGVIVVEAAGNGSNDLDAWTDAGGNQRLNRASAAFQDSGAIMVGAASSGVPHTRLNFSNFGSRVDCYGWGQNVDTTGDGWTGNLTTTYTATFGGTSSASPIVTGAALCVQGAAAASGFRCGPLQMRAILSDPANGTASGSPASDEIGVMPDLRRILQNVLGAAEDVYLRDYVGDTGAPHTGPVSASPDVILRPAAELNPQAAFGQGSGTENSTTLGNEAIAGQDNFLYVRVLNRGGAPAANVTATVYWSPVATLVTPDLWTLVGTTAIPTVPDGDQLTVSGPVVWPAAQIPASGHYCFVGLVGSANDPAPLAADLQDWATFQRFIRENNNVTWRNFNVVSSAPPAGGSAPPGFVALPFLAVGAPKVGALMQLDVHARLPKGSRLMVAAPEHLLDALRIPQGQRIRDRKAERRTARVPLNPHGRSDLGHAFFTAGVRHRLELLVAIPERQRDREFDVVVRQLHEGAEVGRVTWRLSRPNEGRPAGARRGSKA
jgi:serine protease